MMHVFHTVSHLCSKITTEKYSTSFASAIKLLHKDLQVPIYNIYGFVRFADEIVDTFHDFDKEALLHEFEKQTFEAIEKGISLNPILNSFQITVKGYAIDVGLIKAFFRSMRLDLNKSKYNKTEYEDYIYGSAEVVGLMCLYVFCEGDKVNFDRLKPYAQSLGSAFQKVNFLRDLKADFEGLERVYFPGCDFRNFSQLDKESIESDIQKDFDHAFEGIVKLPFKAKFGVYVAYKYYISLFKRIKKLQPQRIMEARVRIPNYGKAMIVAKAGVRNQFNIL